MKINWLKVGGTICTVAGLATSFIGGMISKKEQNNIISAEVAKEVAKQLADKNV